MERLVLDHAWQNHRSLFFAEKSVTPNTYLDMLQLYPMTQLPDGKIYQQDGVPPQFAKIVRTYLEEQFPARWIGRGSPYVTWPARSSDLTLPNFFLWGHVKDQVYRTPVKLMWFGRFTRKNLCCCQGRNQQTTLGVALSFLEVAIELDLELNFFFLHWHNWNK